MFGIIEGISGIFSDEEFKVLSPKKREKVVREVLEQIDMHLEDNDAEVELDDDGFRYFGYGSTQGWAGVVESDEILYLVVEGIVLEQLPSDQDLLMPLMRELLVRNMELPGEARLGLRDEQVVVGFSVPLPDAWSFSVGRHIDEVMELADDLDDRFLSKYSGSSRTRSGNGKPTNGR